MSPIEESLCIFIKNRYGWMYLMETNFQVIHTREWKFSDNRNALKEESDWN